MIIQRQYNQISKKIQENLNMKFATPPKFTETQGQFLARNWNKLLKQETVPDTTMLDVLIIFQAANQKVICPNYSKINYCDRENKKLYNWLPLSLLVI